MRHGKEARHLGLFYATGYCCGQRGVTPPGTLGDCVQHASQGHLRVSVGQATDFSSGHDFVVCEFRFLIGPSAGSAEPTEDPLLPSLSLYLSSAVSLSQK